MNEHEFLQSLHNTAKEVGINPLLLLSGIEGLYTFRDVELNALNHDFLDSLILTIFALRIGDHFHTLAEENKCSVEEPVQQAAQRELQPMSHDEIAQSANPYLQAFANLLQGKSVIYKYHEKALEAAALEIETTQIRFQQKGIGTIVLNICLHHLKESVDLSFLFRS